MTLDVSQGDDTVISTGLEQGELVVVDGAERLREGSKVEVKEPGRAKGAGKGSRPVPGVQKKKDS